MTGRLLFLAHRLPYPPDKGDRIRSWHMLERLARSWQVDVGCLSDDAEDAGHVPRLRAMCGEVFVAPIAGGMRAAARALMRVRPGLPLTLGWFHSPALQSWVAAGLAAGRWDAAFVYSSAMAPYVMGADAAGLRRVLDLVDVDSDKWAAYAADARFPRRQVWAREGRTLLAFERAAVRAFDHSLLVSQPEAVRFLELAPEARARLSWVENGVDLARFDGHRRFDNPYGDAPVLVFTGTMDYRPNVEAVVWFAHAVMPLLRQAGLAPEFHIVGARPAAAVLALQGLPGVRVVGRVADTRPYIVHAAAAVAPLRIARGIQNKVLEAMAMGRPVIASSPAFEGVRAVAGQELLVADGAEDTASAVLSVLRGEHAGLGAAARLAMVRGHDWGVTLAPLDQLLPAPSLATVACA